MTTITVTVLDGSGQPIDQTKVLFNVIDGPNQGRNSGLFLVSVDQNGQASFSYQSNGLVGTDIVRVDGSFGTISYQCSATVEWHLGGVHCDDGVSADVTLPAVAAYRLPTKNYQLSYGTLPLSFAVQKSSTGLCEATSNIGRLPIFLSHPQTPGLSVKVGESVSQATLTAYPRFTLPTLATCDWKTLKVTNNCIVDGDETFDEAAVYMRWSVPGFSVVPVVPDLNLQAPPLSTKIPPQTLWINLSKRGLDSGTMSAVIPAVESEIHQKLVSRLPALSWWTLIQDPGAVRVLVIDGTGRTTGTLPDGRKTNDILDSMIVESATDPGALFRGSRTGVYQVLLTGLQNGPYELGLASIDGPFGAEQTLVAGVIGKNKSVAYRAAATESNGVLTATLAPMKVVPSDLNGDEKVNCADIAVVNSSFGLRLGQTGFNAWADVDSNGVVDVKDITWVTKRLPHGSVCR